MHSTYFWALLSAKHDVRPHKYLQGLSITLDHLWSAAMRILAPSLHVFQVAWQDFCRSRDTNEFYRSFGLLGQEYFNDISKTQLIYLLRTLPINVSVTGLHSSKNWRKHRCRRLEVARHRWPIIPFATACVANGSFESLILDSEVPWQIRGVSRSFICA